MDIKKLSTQVILLIFTLISCKSDDSKEETFLCCGDNPFAELNVDNLGDDSIFLQIPDVFTPNSDGINDTFILPLINDYPNYSITIFDLNEVIVFESDNNIFFNGKDHNTGEELKFGSYKYKIVIENEQIFIQYGYLCMVRNNVDVNGFDFSNCRSPQTLPGVDPVLNN